MPSKRTESVRIEFSLEFKRNLRVLAKRYRHIRSDVQPVLGRLQAGDHLNMDFVTDLVRKGPSDCLVLKKVDTILGRDNPIPCTFIWTPDQSIASGIYLVKARTEDGGTAEQKVVYVR